MKKILTFLALCCLMVTEAWAQSQVQTVKTSPAADGTTYYLYTLESGNNAGKYWAAPGGMLNAQSLTSTQWYFETTGTDGVYYVRDYGTGKYLYYSTGNKDDVVNLGDTKSEWTVQVHNDSQKVTLSPNGKDNIGINYSSNHIVYDAAKNGNPNSWWKMCEYEGTAPAEKVSVTYVFTNAYNETVSLTDEASLGSTATAPSVSYLSNATITDEDKVVSATNTTFHVSGTWSFPFQESKYYTMKSNSNNYVFDGTNAWYNNSVAVANHNDLWQFEHVSGTLDLYKLKTYSGKYAVLSGSGRIALTFADTPTEWESGTGATSYFRVVAQNGGFDLQHPGDAETNVGSHVDGMLGSWKAGNSPTNGASINKVEEVTVTPAVVVPSTLNPASGNVEASALATITLQFTGEDVEQQGLIPMTAEKMGETPVYPTLTKGTTVITATSIALNEETGLNEITFLTTGITDGEWTLTIPEGAFWIWNGDLDAEAQPVAEITATYTVGNVVAFDADKYYTISCLKNGAYANYNPNAVENDETYLARTGSATSFSSYFRIVANGDYWNIIPAATPDKYVYAISTENKDANVGIGSMDATADAALWQIVKNGDGFNIIPKGGSNGWNCRGSKNGVDVIGQWDHNDTNDNRWVFTEVDTHITDLANLSNDKAYVLICERGQLSTSEGQFVPVAKDREDAYTAKANKFAIIKSGDKYYLWSVAEDGYVHTSKYINTVYAAQEITLTHQDDDTFLLKLAGNSVNMQNNANGILINGWGQADEGNKYAIYEVDDFADAEKAIAAIPGKIQVGKVYTIKAHFTGEDYTDHYLSSDASTEQLTLTDEDSATQSYWVAEASGNTERPWKFKSGYGYAKYLDWQNGGLTANGDNFKLIGYVNAGTPVSFDYNLNVSTDNRNIGAWADASKGFGAVGQGLCWAGNAGHNNSDWTTDYIIEEVTGVDVYTVSGNATTGVTGITDYTYASSIGNGSVVIVPTGTELTNANFTTESDVAVIINSEAHTITVRAKGCPDEGTWYVTIENHEKGRQPFLFNDIEYADGYTEQGSSVAGNGYTWKVTSDGSGNLTSVKNAENGEGIKINGGTDYISSFPYEAVSEDEGYYYLGVSDSYLNAANGNYVNGHRVVTTWSKENASKWRFNVVDTEDLVEYNVVVSPAESRGYALYDGKKAGNGGFFLAPEGLTQSDFAGGELRGFICDGVTLTDHTVTVTYTAATPVQVNYSLYLKEGDTETLLETAAEAVSEYVGQAPAHPFTVPDYVDVTYDQGVDENGLIDGNATAIKVITSYNDLMPFTPGELTTVDIDIRNHYYFHVEERTITIDGESKKLWLPCISPKAPDFDDDAAYIWRMEGDWYHGFRFHNDQLAKEGEGDGTACHITYKHKEVMSETMEQMEGMKGATSLTEKTYTLVSTTDLSIASRATLTGDADDRNSYFELVHATGDIQHYNGEPAEWQFRLMDHKNLYLNFRDYSRLGDNPDSLLCLYGAGYGDNASSFTFHKEEVCTEDDRQAVLAMIDAIEKGAVGALIDKDAQEYQDLLTLKGRIEDTTIGCTRALFDAYTEKLVNANKERKVATDGEAYRLALRTKQGRNFYLKDDGTYTTDSLAASIYVLGSSADGTKKILAGNNNEALYYFRNGGLTQAAYETASCDLNCELMTNKETVADVLDATGAAKYATVCLTDGNGKVATMTSPDKAVVGGDCEWEAQDVVYMNDELSSAIVMEPVPYPYNKPKFAVGSPDDHEGGYASIWLPYPMIFPDGVEVYRATDAESDGLLVLKKVNTDRVVAAGGYIIRDPNKASTMTVLPAPANPDDVEYSETNAFVGSTENPLVVKEEGSWSAFLTAQGNPTGTPYVLAKKNDVIGYYKYNAGTDDLLPKGKAIWFSNYKADSSSDCLRFSFGDIVEAIKALNGEATDAEIYDLQGHRLNKAVKGQINVINGKKVMFK